MSRKDIPVDGPENDAANDDVEAKASGWTEPVGDDPLAEDFEADIDPVEQLVTENADLKD